MQKERFSFDTASIWALTITALLAAVAFIPVATIPFLFTKVTIIAIGGLIALAFFILARLTRGNIIVPPVMLLGALWLVPIAYGLSTLFSGTPASIAFFGTELEPDTFGFMLILAAFASLTALVFRRVAHYGTFFKVAAISAAAIFLVQIGFVLVGHFAPNLVAPSANLIGSFVDFGMFVGLAVITGLLALRFLTVAKRTRTFIWVVVGVGLALLALVNSVLVWTLVALVGLGLFIEAIMSRRPSSVDSDLDGVTMISEESTDTMNTGGHDASGLGAPLVVLIIALFFLIGSGTIGNSLTTAFKTNILDVRPSWQSTFAVGSHAYASQPIFGSGPGTFGTEWLKFRDRALNDTVFWNVDFTSGVGLIPTSFVTTGALGALAWLAFLGLFLFFGLRALLFRAPTDPFVRFVSMATFTGSLYVLALSVFSVPGPIVLLLGFFMIGLFISSLRYGKNRAEWGIVFAKNPRVGFVIVFGLTLLLLGAVLAAYVVTERYLSSVSYAKASQAISAGDLDGAAKAVGDSILFAPTDRAYQLAAAIGIARMNQIASDTKLSPSDAQQKFQAALSGSIDAALTATRLSPNNYQNWAVLGSVYQTVVPLNIDGAYQNAKTAYEKAVTLNPTNPALPYILAQLEIAQKNTAAAETDLTTAISLKHDYTQAIFLLSQLEAQMGKAKEALQAAEAAMYFAPNDPTVLFQVGILRSGTGDITGAIQALSHAVELNPQYANARFFLAVAYANAGKLDQALAQLQAVAELSPENATALAANIAQLQAGKNPFPASKLGALSVPAAPVSDTAGSKTGTPAATTH
jgi:tetratricopeptide (TPR) repeat protein